MVAGPPQVEAGRIILGHQLDDQRVPGRGIGRDAGSRDPGRAVSIQVDMQHVAARTAGMGEVRGVAGGLVVDNMPVADPGQHLPGQTQLPRLVVHEPSGGRAGQQRQGENRHNRHVSDRLAHKNLATSRLFA
jgi:hypothetical protein